MIGLRFLIINALLRSAGALISANERALGIKPPRTTSARPAGECMCVPERILLASLAGIAICAAWIAFTWRAWG